MSIQNNPISGEGFWGAGAPLVADLNLVVQVLKGATQRDRKLSRSSKHYRAHAVTQTKVRLLNLAMIATVMWPSTSQRVMPVFPRSGRGQDARETPALGSWSSALTKIDPASVQR